MCLSRLKSMLPVAVQLPVSGLYSSAEATVTPLKSTVFSAGY